MPRHTLALAALLVGANLAAGAALAQQKPFAMPPPPSASDPAPKAERAGKPAKKTPARRRTSGDPTFAPTDRSTASRSDVRDRIDTRGPAGRRMELEDEPNVRPTFENGRPGMGMRF